MPQRTLADGRDPKTYTSCTSMTRISEVEFTALEDLLNIISKREDLRLVHLNFSKKMRQILGFLNMPVKRWKRIEPDFSLAKQASVNKDENCYPYATFLLKGPAKKLYVGQHEEREGASVSSARLSYENSFSLAEEESPPLSPGGKSGEKKNALKGNRKIWNGRDFELARFCNLSFSSLGQETGTPTENNQEEVSGFINVPRYQSIP